MQEFDEKTGTGADWRRIQRRVWAFFGCRRRGRRCWSPKTGSIVDRITMSCTPFDSSLNTLQFWLWMQSNRTDRLAANSRNVSAGVSATMRGPLLFRDFVTERLLWWYWTHKTFDRTFKGLSNGVQNDYIWLKLREIIEFYRDPWTLTERFSLQIPNFKNLPRPNDYFGKTTLKRH